MDNMHSNGRLRMPVTGAKTPAPRKGKNRDAKLTGPRRWLTVALGCGIPGLSLALSSVGGRLMTQCHVGLEAGAIALCCTVLALSLSHLAWAVKDITRSPRWQVLVPRCGIDLSLVLCELAGVAGFSLWLVPVVMVAVTVSSAALNCWAFLRG